MELFNKGQKLTLSFTKDNKLVEIVSIVNNVYNDSMTVDLPTYFMRYIQYLSVGSNLTAKVFSKVGTLNFRTIVINSPLEDEFKIELDMNAIKLEMADDVPPVSAIEKLKINVLSGKEILCNTVEISMNGIKFNSNIEFEMNTEVDCSLTLDEIRDTIIFKAIVNDRNLLYDTEYSAIYTTMTEEAKQNLLYFMYMYSQNNTDGNEE